MRLQSLHVLLLVKSENTCDDLSQRQERNEEHWKDMVLFGLCTEEISIKVQIWPNIWTWGKVLTATLCHGFVAAALRVKIAKKGEEQEGGGKKFPFLWLYL